jgi:plasmid rolling circle replication initiator protein Rep
MLAQNLTKLESPLNKGYRRTLFDCGGLIIQEGQKLTSKYCNARWCNTCNRIRTAKLLNGYQKPLQAFAEPYFVTLTIPNVSEFDLKDAIKSMLRSFQLIVRSRRRLTPINGIRKLECTINAESDTYHPHFHVLVDGEENAQYLISEWLKRYELAESWCQDMRSADKGSLSELFKYTTKIVSKTKNGDFNIYIRKLDVIFNAMYKLRTFQSFGSVRMVTEDIDKLKSDTYDIEFKETEVYLWANSDWYSMSEGLPLTEYVPSTAMIKLTTDKMII